MMHAIHYPYIYYVLTKGLYFYLTFIAIENFSKADKFVLHYILLLSAQSTCMITYVLYNTNLFDKHNIVL